MYTLHGKRENIGHVLLSGSSCCRTSETDTGGLYYMHGLVLLIAAARAAEPEAMRLFRRLREEIISSDIYECQE